MISLERMLARRGDILRLAAEHGARNPRLFGSVARGEARDGSDLDILVQLDADRSLIDHVALVQDLEDLLQCPVDVVNESAMDHRLRDRILAEAVPL